MFLICESGSSKRLRSMPCCGDVFVVFMSSVKHNLLTALVITESSFLRRVLVILVLGGIG